MRIIIRRFWELLLPMIFMSAITTFLYVNTLVPTNRTVSGIIMLFMSVLYLMYNGYLLQGCFDDMYQAMDYYFYNITAYLLFAMVNALLYFYADTNTYTWLFALTKTFSVLFENVSTLLSVGIFNGVIILLIIAAPWIRNN